MKECIKTKNLVNCNCTYEPCNRKGNCCECINYHRNSGEMPACYFSKDDERTYDRSIEKFISAYKEKNRR